jgi:phenylpropionate dioxygenase-like ring-hydroxylating dioxygenase large terminal subunit
MTYLRNSWYCAGWSSDLADKPIGIRICDEDIVIFRDSTGTAVALDGRCPHRFAPLSRGCVKGDTIECGYHGLQFDRTGACTHNPHGRQIVPPRARVRPYPIAERNGALWVWMGEAALADPATIIDFDFVADRAAWTGITGYLRIKADYQLVIDNLLDLTHGTYLHPHTLGVDPEHSLGAELKYDFRTEGTTVHSNYTFLNSPPTALFKLFFPEPTGDIYAFMRWEPAGSLILDISTTTTGQPKGTGVLMPSAHLIVPEGPDSCHYFFALSRNVEHDDQDKTAAMAEIARFAFVEEDEPVIHDCFRMMRGQEFFGLEPAILETDIAGIQARRILQKLISKEQRGLAANRAA